MHQASRSWPLLFAGAVLALVGCSPEESAPDDTATEATPSPTDEDGTSPEEGDTATGDDTAADEEPSGDGTGDDQGDDAGDGEDGAEASGDEIAAVEDLEFTTCEADDLTIDYPSSWTAYEGPEIPQCRIFHPEPLDEVQPESFHYAVRMIIDPVDFETATGGTFGEILQQEMTTVAGRDAMVVESESEGDAMMPAGERTYSYTVDLDGMILVGSTTTIGDTDYERDKQILDRMMETVSVDLQE